MKPWIQSPEPPNKIVSQMVSFQCSGSSIASCFTQSSCWNLGCIQSDPCYNWTELVFFHHGYQTPAIQNHWLFLIYSMYPCVLAAFLSRQLPDCSFFSFSSLLKCQFLCNVTPVTLRFTQPLTGRT
jgi:hypothetical protein